MASRASHIVTYNPRDFRQVDRFGIRAVRPEDFLPEIENSDGKPERFPTMSAVRWPARSTAYQDRPMISISSPIWPFEAIAFQDGAVGGLLGRGPSRTSSGK